MKVEKSISTLPLKASDLKPVYDGPKDLKKIAIKSDSIRMSGDAFFYTIQGEGPTIGYPAVFARLHHCNLTCSFCDAWYTWDKESQEFWTESYAMGFDEVVEVLEKTWFAETGNPENERRVVWTGGEPLMQKNQIDEVMERLWFGGHEVHRPFWHPEVETNGTIMPTKVQLDNFQFNVSPKLKNSGNSPYKMVKPKVLAALNQANSTFKFVCRDEYDLAEIQDKYCKHIDESKIIIMPEGVVEEEITKHARYLAPFVKELCWRMTPRLQAIAFDGAARGV